MDTLDGMSITVGLALMRDLVHSPGCEIHDGARESFTLATRILAG